MIFVHVPKTGGQSIEKVFYDEFGLAWGPCKVLLVNVNKKKNSAGRKNLAHLFAHEYLAYGFVTPQQFQEYFKFAVVRNPFDRLVSEYKFKFARHGVTFKDFLFKWFSPKDWSDRQRHVEPMWKYIYDRTGTQPLVNRVLRYENYDEVAPLLESILDHPVRMPMMNAAQDRRPWQEFYDNECRAFARKVYHRDFELFGYDIEG